MLSFTSHFKHFYIKKHTSHSLTLNSTSHYMLQNTFWLIATFGKHLCLAALPDSNKLRKSL